MKSLARAAGVSVIVAALVLSGLLFVPVATVHASGTVSTVDISSAISGQGEWWTVDTSLNVGWISVGVSQNNLYKVNLPTVVGQGAAAVTGYPSIFGDSACTGFGSLANGVAATAVLGGDVYATYWCGSSAIGVAQIRESDGTVLNTWLYSVGSPTAAQGIVTDGVNLYVCATGVILKLTTSGVYSVVHSISGSCVSDIFIGSKLWFSEGSGGIGEVNTDGSGFVELGCGGCSTAYFLASDGLGNVFFTDSIAHKLFKYDGASFTSYPTGMASTGPYGITYDSARGGFWLAGWANLKDRFFAVSNSSFVAARDITTGKKPFMGGVDGSGNVWQFAVGSTDIIEIASSSSSNSASCTPTIVSANPNGWPTVGVNGSSAFHVPNADFSARFFLWDYDAPTFAAVLGPCGLVVDKTSFAQLNITKVAYSVDGGVQVQVSLKSLVHQRELVMCSDGRFFSNMSRDWSKCGSGGDVYAVQTWSFTLSLSLSPNVCNQPHSATVFAWGNNGVGPFRASIIVDNSLCAFAGSYYAIQFPSSAVGSHEWVNSTALLSDQTSQGQFMQTVQTNQFILVPAGGLVYGMSPPSSKLSVSGSGIQTFVVQDEQYGLQTFVVR